MAEPTYSVPGTLEILRTVNLLRANLVDKTSQDEFLRVLIRNKNTSAVCDAVMIDLIGQLHSKIESWVETYGMSKHTDSEPEIPSTGDFWAMGSEMLSTEFLELVGYKETSYKRKRDESQDLGHNAASEQVFPGVGSAQGAKICNAEETSESAEKRLKLSPTTKPLEQEISESTERGVWLGTMSEPAHEKSMELEEKPTKLDPTKPMTEEEMRKPMDEQHQSDAQVKVPDQIPESGNPRNSNPRPEEQTRMVDGVDAAPEIAVASKEPQPRSDSLFPKEASRPPPEQTQAADIAKKAKPTPARPSKSKADGEDDDEYHPPGFDQSKKKSESSGVVFVKEVEIQKNRNYASKSAAGPVFTVEQRKQWAREVGAVDLPDNLPTRKPANPCETAIKCDKTYVEKQMASIESDLWTAMLACFQENHIDPGAPAKFVLKPEEELEHLYEVQFGGRWQSKIAQLAARKPPVVLRQDYSFMGLLGTGIYTAVFKSSLPWDAANEVGCNEKYLAQVLNDLGHELVDVVKAMKSKQIADGKFRKAKVAPYARKLAGSLELVLIPHIKRMSRLTKRAKSVQQEEYEPWYVYLDAALQSAVILRQNLTSSKQGRFGTFWPKADEDHFDVGLHRAIFASKPEYELDAIHTILPGVKESSSKKEICFARALVLPGPREIG